MNTILERELVDEAILYKLNKTYIDGKEEISHDLFGVIPVLYLQSKAEEIDKSNHRVTEYSTKFLCRKADGIWIGDKLEYKGQVHIIEYVHIGRYIDTVEAR